MSNIIDDIIKIKYNAFTLAGILLAFYDTCTIEKDSFLLYKFIIPIVSSKYSMNNGLGIRAKSSLSSWIINDKLHLAGIEDRVRQLEDCSRTALQYCFDRDWASVDGNNNVVVSIDKQLKKELFKNQMCKNAQSLNKLFNQLSVADILLQLGLYVI